MTSTLSAEEMASIPAGTPPPGVESNLVDPPSDGYILYIVGGIVMGLMYITAGLSLYAKLTIRRRMAPDDWTRLIAMIGATFYFIICILAVAKGKYGTHMYDLSALQAMSDAFIITGYFSNWVTAIVWPFAKTSFFLIYLEMFRTIKWQRYAIYFGLFVNWAFYTIILIATLYYTSPAPGQTWAEGFVSTRYSEILKWTVPIASGSLIIDLYILILPMAPIWNLQMDFKKRVGVMVVFGTGLLACVASSLSIYFKNILDHHTDDFSYYTLPVLIMCLVEMCVGISASSMPSLTLLVRHKGTKLTQLVSIFTRSRSTTGGGKMVSGSDGYAKDSDCLPLKDVQPPTRKQSTPVDQVSDDGYDHYEGQTVQTMIQASPSTGPVGQDQIYMHRGFDVGYEYRGKRMTGDSPV
ncbi:hypothetical protein BDV40DRAFT_294723 [Aspergillus tamarii]|uniref:Rhodopsin domain-containing protein n=1 Tax=Aspergillus tamarii TaxID=41984 RepID=A0A5N6VAY5_ASPTM|nr:hypothetical protein BDV40DRAFT_294723 [Aspergillus tamarii]